MLSLFIFSCRRTDMCECSRENNAEYECETGMGAYSQAASTQQRFYILVFPPLLPLNCSRKEAVFRE